MPRSSATLPFLPLLRITFCIFRGLRSHDGQSRSHFSPNEGLNRSYYKSKLHNQNKLSTYIVARSELTGTGAPDAADSLSEIKLNSKVSAVTAIAAILLVGFMLMAHPFVFLFDRYRRKAQHFIAKLWATATLAPYFKIDFEGLENLASQDAPAVYVSNHQKFFRHLYTSNSWKKLQVYHQDWDISLSNYWMGHVYDGFNSIKVHGQQKPVGVS